MENVKEKLKAINRLVEMDHAILTVEFAEVIAESMNLKYPAMFGIGSRLRVACAAVKEYLTGGR